MNKFTITLTTGTQHIIEASEINTCDGCMTLWDSDSKIVAMFPIGFVLSATKNP